MGRALLPAVAVSSSPTHRCGFVARAAGLEKKPQNFQPVLSVQSRVLCGVPGELCAFHTHYEMGRNAFSKSLTLLLKLFDFCLFLAEISLLSLSPALAVAVVFGEATHFWVGRSRQFVPAW